MFYDVQNEEQKESYKKLLEIIGSLTLLFSDSRSPYLPYRCHENIFCKCFDADNLARHDCSADARKSKCGIGLKTWTGSDDQKIAEFGKLRPQYENLEDEELVRTIARFRNERIRVTKNLYGIEELVYHIVKRVPGFMRIVEHVFEPIDIDNIQVSSRKSTNNNIYFNDGKHKYHFSLSKNTLYMIFSDYVLLDEFPVNIIPDPLSVLMNLRKSIIDETGVGTEDCVSGERIEKVLMKHRKENQLCLRLYSTKKGQKYVPDCSGLNTWNGYRTRRDKNGNIIDSIPRDPNEVYISFPAKDRKKFPNFFPDRNCSFDLRLPDGKVISAKVCQADGKAIMSNPNSDLGKWLLRDVFELPEGTVVTYEMLEQFGIDSVVFTKLGENTYSVDFAELGTYELFNTVEEEPLY